MNPLTDTVTLNLGGVDTPRLPMMILTGRKAQEVHRPVEQDLELITREEPVSTGIT